MTESGSDSIVLSSDDGEGVPFRPRRFDDYPQRSPDMFELSSDWSSDSKHGPSGGNEDDEVVCLDSPAKPGAPTVDPVVVEISDSDDDVDPLRKPKEGPPTLKPKEQPKKKRTRKKKASINLSELESALSEIALSNENANKERLSFLSSLSENTFGLSVHPEAHFYKSNFKHLKEKLSSVLFDMFNNQVFSSGLPKDTKVEWSGRLTSTAGKTLLIKRRTGAFESSIVLSAKILTTAEKLRDTLIHEMCHAAAFTIDRCPNANHGPVWKKWTKLATKRFPELPPIDVRHSYSIQFKYNWACQKCGHIVGRHKDVVDVNRHRCPFCYGIFQRVTDASI